MGRPVAALCLLATILAVADGFLPPVVPSSPLARLRRAGSLQRQPAPPRAGPRIRAMCAQMGSETVYELSNKLQQAVKDEDYALAAKLRDEIKARRSDDPVASAKDLLAESLRKEDFRAASEAKERLGAAVKDRSKGLSPVKVNRLLVQLRNGGLLSCSPDGAYSLSYSDEADKNKFQHFQPTWSPSGDLVVYTRIDLRTKDSTSSEVFVVWAQDGVEQLQLRAPFVPFYFYWTPSGCRLTYLTTHADGIKRAVGLETLKVWEEPEAGQSLNDLLDDGRQLSLQNGTPLFYSHCPRDNRMLCHIGDKKKIAVFEPATLAEVVLSTRPGNFRAPQWLPQRSPDGQELVMFVELKENDRAGMAQSLVLAEAVADGRKRELMDVEGFTSFSVSPDGQKCAIMCRGPKQQDGDYLSVLEGPFEIDDDWPSQRIPVAGAVPNEGLGDIPPAKGVFAYFWSPDSTKLLVLTGPGKMDIAAQQQKGLQWEVFDYLTQTTTMFLDFIPTPSFVGSFLPFFDQYALSHNLWAPDSKSFCYTGKSFAGEEGAWVQEVPARGQPPPPPTLVWEEAEMVSWSPR